MTMQQEIIKAKNELKIIIALILTAFIILNTQSTAKAEESSTAATGFVNFVAPILKQSFGDNCSIELSADFENVIDVRIWGINLVKAKEAYLVDEEVRESYKGVKNDIMALNDSIYNTLKLTGLGYDTLLTVRGKDQNDEVIFAYYNNECIYDSLQDISMVEEYGNILKVIVPELNNDYLFELEKRIEALEAYVFGNNSSQNQIAWSNDPIVLSGIYVVGENIEPGSYSLSVLEGNSTGQIAVFQNYDSYIEYSGNQYYALFYEDLRTPDYSREHDDQNWDDYFNGFQTSISNLTLRDGMCVVINGVQVEAVKK